MKNDGGAAMTISAILDWLEANDIVWEPAAIISNEGNEGLLQWFNEATNEWEEIYAATLRAAVTQAVEGES